MASKEVMGKINKLIDETFFVKDNREQDSDIKEIDSFKSRISHSRLINEIKKDINELYAIGKFDDLINIRNILYLNLNIWILSYNIESTVLKDERKKMLDIKSHAIKTVLDIINSLLDPERYPVTLSYESINRLKEQHQHNKKEIINSIPNLFQFIEYLHSNINHFNDWAKWIPIFTGEQTEIDESDEEFYKSKVENHSSKLTTGKIRILTRIWLIIPFREKVRNLDIAHLDKKEYNFIHNKYNQAATALIYKVKEDKSYIREIHKIYGLYFGFKRKIDPRFIKLYPLLFVTLDNVIKSIRSIRYFQADRLTPEVEFIEFERKDDKLKNSISEEFQPMSIETKSDDANVVVVETPNDNSTKITPQTKTLFNFIDYLHSNIERFNQCDEVILEWKIARWEERQFKQHYSKKLKMRKVQKVIKAKWNEISEHLIEPIKEKAIEVDVCVLDNPKTIYTVFSHDISMLEEKFLEEDVGKIKRVKRQYIEIRNDINPHIILLLKDFFLYFDELMKHLVKFFYEDGDRTIPRIVDIYLDDYFSTPESFELPLTGLKSKTNPPHSKTKNNDGALIKSDKENNIKVPNKIQPLFDFIDFLHANIENFNQYNEVIKDLHADQKHYSSLGTHYTQIKLKRELEEKNKIKWNIIYENIVTPIKDKVVELDLFDWSAPETLSNNHMPLVLRLSENCDDQDVDAILKAKNQYIEFANEINPNVVKQAELIFRYLNEVMSVIAKDFEEEGDMPIKFREVRKVETLEELVEGFNASHVPERTSDNVDEDLETKEKSKQYTIDTTTLNKYFHPAFKGRGNNSSDHFSQLIKDIKLLDNQKEIGQLALMIFESKNINSQIPDTFSSWYRIFCKCVGGKVTYKKSQLRNPKNSIKLIFNYIEPK